MNVTELQELLMTYDKITSSIRQKLQQQQIAEAQKQCKFLSTWLCCKAHTTQTDTSAPYTFKNATSFTTSKSDEEEHDTVDSTSELPSDLTDGESVEGKPCIPKEDIQQTNNDEVNNGNTN